MTHPRSKKLVAEDTESQVQPHIQQGPLDCDLHLFLCLL